MKGATSKPSFVRRIKDWSKRRKIVTSLGVVCGVFVLFFAVGLWGASGQILKPSFKGVTDFAACAPDTQTFFGEQCGNLRNTKQYNFSEVKIVSENGELPGWLIKTADNGHGQPEGAIMLVHAGGSDRRQMTKLVGQYLKQKLDVLTFDMSCQGEAPCNRAGITYGERESLDVIAAYNFLSSRYGRTYAMGTSVGAAAVLIALPEMPKLAGAIAENPLANFRRLLKEAPEAQSMPGWFTDTLASLAMWRGGFNGEKNAETALTQVKNVPVLFMHSKKDKTIAPAQTEDIAAGYQGPKSVLLTEDGEHAALWDANHESYEKTIAGFLQTTR